MTRPDSDDDEDTDRRRPTAAERRLHQRSHPYGVPVIRLAADPQDEPQDDLPFDWGDIPDRQDADGLRRAGRDPSRPVAPAELSAIIRQLARRLRNEFSQLLTQVPADIAGRIEDRLVVLEQDFAPVRRVGRWAAGAALAALVAVGGFLYHRGRDEQHVTDELQRLTALVDKLERKIDSLQTGPRP